MVVPSAMLVCMMACGGRGAQDLPGPPVDAVPVSADAFPPPPADATASCVYQATPEGAVSTSTVWFNSLGQVIRVDGWFVNDSGDIVPAPYYFAYDSEGRLVEQKTIVDDIHYAYTPQQITQSSSLGGDWIYTLVDGRAVHLEGPEQQPPDQRWMIDYTYDSAGRYASRTGVGFYDAGKGIMKYSFAVQYSYDAQGRVASAQVMNSGVTSQYAFSYTETANQLVINVNQSVLSYGQRWTYDFDASHRVIRAALNYGGGEYYDYTYSYMGNEIDEVNALSPARTVHATGSCAPPAPVTLPEPPLPIHWSANLVSLSHVSVFTFNNL